MRRLGALRIIIPLLSSPNDDVQRWAVMALNNINEKEPGKAGGFDIDSDDL